LRHSISTILALLLLAGAASNTLAGPLVCSTSTSCGFLYDGSDFRTINIAAAHGTYLILHDINNSGQIVGHYGLGMFPEVGFVYSAGRITTLEVPGAFSTRAHGINEAGQVVGDYEDPDTGNRSGFLYDNGVFTRILAPGSSFTIATDINNSGQIVGFFADATGQHPFLYDAGGFTPINVSGDNPAAWGINDRGQIVGGFADLTAGLNRGFLYDAGTITPIDPPGGLNTRMFKINNAGQIVGSSGVGALGGAHGFVYQNGVFTPIDVPGAASTMANAINDSGQIVGTVEIFVPEPSSMFLLSAGLAAFGAGVRRRQRRRREPIRNLSQNFD